MELIILKRLKKNVYSFKICLANVRIPLNSRGVFQHEAGKWGICEFWRTAFLIMFTAAGISFSEENRAQQIIQRIEECLFPNSQSDILLKFEGKGKVEEKYEFKIYSKNRNSKIIVRFTAPPTMIGNDILMINKNVWSYNKEAGRIVKIPSNMSFGSTDFSYGDVVRLNFTDNYSARIIDGKDTLITLELVAKERSAPYHKVLMKVDKKTEMPISANCYARGGDLIKTVEYSDFKMINGTIKPRLIRIKSSKRKENVSTMITRSEELKEFPDRIFNKYNLGTTMEEGQ